MPHAPLPIELIEIIVDNLAQDRGSDLRVNLKNCALACWSFLPICRKYLFASISVAISPHRQNRRLTRLVTFLRRSPEIASYTRNLELYLSPMLVEPLPTELKLFTRLETYRLTFNRNANPMESNYFDFDNVTVQTKEILLHPILTLKRLELNSIANFPFYELLRYCPNIRQLELADINVDKISIPTGALPLDPIKLEKFSSPTFATDSQAMAIQKLFELQQSNGQPVIDFSSLKHWDVCYTDSDKWELLQEMVLPRTNQLTTVVLIADSNEFYLRGLGQVLLPSAKNLKTISIYADVLTPEVDPLCGLCEELEILGEQPNVLETLIYYLTVYPDSECSTGDDWRKLDQVIDRFAWPMLKTIQLTIDPMMLRDRGYTGTTDFRKNLDALPEKQLPKLLTRSRQNLDFLYKICED